MNLARDGSDAFIKVARECGSRLSHSIYGPWLILTRLSNPCRPKGGLLLSANGTTADRYLGVTKSFMEFMEVPLAEDGVYGYWKPMDGNPKSEPRPSPSPLPLPIPKRKREEVEVGRRPKRLTMSESPLSTRQATLQRAGSQPPHNNDLLSKIEISRRRL
jgi:hypothetical protein